MREMGNWNEYFMNYLATDREASNCLSSVDIGGIPR